MQKWMAGWLDGPCDHSDLIRGCIACQGDLSRVHVPMTLKGKVERPFELGRVCVLYICFLLFLPEPEN